MSARPRLRLVTTVLALAAPLAVPIATATSAQAVPVICDGGTSWYSTSGGPTYTLTHVTGYHVSPGSSISVTKTAAWERTLSAGITISAGGSVSASGVIASAEANYSVSLAASGTLTNTSSESITGTVSSSSSDRYYAAYAGRRYWTGSYTKYQCNSSGTYISTVASGSWRSFQSNLEGIALCPASRYSSTSLAYKACKQTWG